MLSMTCDRLGVSTTNNTDHQHITEILLKVAVSTITLTDTFNSESRTNFGSLGLCIDKYIPFRGYYLEIRRAH